MSSSGKVALLVVPGNNTTMAREIAAYCPQIAQWHIAKVPRPPGLLTVADLPAYRASTLGAVSALCIGHADVVLYGCTAAGFLAGPKGDTEISGALADQMGAPVITTAGAMSAALRFSGANRVDVVTPYLDAVNDGLKAYLAASGFIVTSLNSFKCATTDELGRVTEQQVMEKATASRTADSQAMFIACSQLPTYGILPTLRRRFQFPVWASVQATAWAALQALDIPNEQLAA